MTLVEHLYELRRRVGFALLWVFVGAVVGFIWFGVRIGHFPSLGDLMIGPYCQLPQNQRLFLGDGHTCALLQTEPFGQFTIRLKVGIAMGVVLTSPAWLYQIWLFIAPGLYKKERRFAATFVIIAAVLFTIGALMAYLVVPEALKVLSSVGSGTFVTALAADSYISFMINLLVIFGASFELPLVVVMLNRVGVLKYEKLKKWRRGIIFGLFVFAAFATPGQDPISMCALAGGLTLLFEVSVQISRVHDKRKEQERVEAGWDGLADDEAAPLTAVEPIAPAEPMADSEPVARPNTYDDAT